MSLASDVRTAAHLFGNAVEQLGKLVQNEAELAQAEMSDSRLHRAHSGVAANGVSSCRPWSCRRQTPGICSPKPADQLLGLIPGIGLPAPDDPVAIDRIELTEIGAPAGLVGGNQG